MGHKKLDRFKWFEKKRVFYFRRSGSLLGGGGEERVRE